MPETYTINCPCCSGSSSSSVSSESSESCKWYCVQLWLFEQHFDFVTCEPANDGSVSGPDSPFHQCLTDAEYAAIMATGWQNKTSGFPTSGVFAPGIDCDAHPEDCVWECYSFRYTAGLCPDPNTDEDCECEGGGGAIAPVPPTPGQYDIPCCGLL